jgi:glycosyltransferase involved in cell wall biosynthesis
LEWLYQNCLFTVYPSHYEGWGLPVIESLARGKHCVASSSSSLPEAGGQWCDYHDPLDFVACHRLIARAAFDSDYRESKEQAIRDGYRPASWDECAADVARLVEKHFAEAAGPQRLRVG